ncbi:MAG: GDSL-type esterase/lipase family protein [Puniceicoccales bacterium]
MNFSRHFRTGIRTVVLILSLSSLTASQAQAKVTSSEKSAYPDPIQWENSITRFEKKDAANPPPPGAILCIGSSSMKGWHDLIEFDLEPLTVIPRGFGGSNTNDALHYADRIVLPYSPRAIVYYEGENDIAQGIPPEQVADTFQAFVDTVHASLPECRIYVLSIKPSITRKALWPKMQEANQLLEEICKTDEMLTYVDVASGMFNDSGELKSDIFRSDDLHMNRKGYIIWRETLLPVLLENELPYEPSENPPRES